MDDRRNSEPDPMTQARARLAAAAEGVRRLEGAAQQAFCRLAALDAAMLCREAEVLLRYIRSGWVAGQGGFRRRVRQRPGGGAAF